MDPQRYFQSNEHFFWQWEEDGEVIAIPNAYTIAYKVQLASALEYLKLQGFPPFGSLILVLIAVLETSENPISLLKSAYMPQNDDSNVDAENCFKFLECLRSLPKSSKSGEGILEVLRVIFKDCHYGVSAKYTQKLIESFKEKKINLSVAPYDVNQLSKSYRTLALIATKFPDSNAILKALENRKKVDVELEAVIIEPDQLVNELIADSNTSKIGVLVPRLWASLNIPFHSNVPSAQPLGGLADITNKGDYNQLLFSEYANDDVIFMSRLANNEVLYYNREIPPQENNLERIILIDASLKNWGTPKTMALSAALSIQYHPKTHIECATYLFGDKYVKVNLDSVQNITKCHFELWSTLENDKGLASFLESEDLKDKELILISNREAIASSNFQTVLNAHLNQFSFLIESEMDGALNVYKISNKRKKFLQHLALPIDRIWAETKQRPNTRLSFSQDLALIPLKFPNPNGPKLVFRNERKAFKITREKVLLSNDINQLGNVYDKGWTLVKENMLVSSLCAAGVDEEDNDIVAMIDVPNRELYILNCETGVEKTIEFNEWRHSTYDIFYFREGYFYYIDNHRYWQIDCSGHIMAHNNPPVNQLKYYEKVKDDKKQLWKVRGEEYSILKNLTDIYINEDGDLIFNKHALVLNSGQIIKFQTKPVKPRMFDASEEGPGVFEFLDGSKIIVNKIGVFTLVSSDLSIPKIYVPSVIDRNLGVCNDTEYSGNSFYSTGANFEVEVTDPGANKIAVIKGMRSASIHSLGLKDAKDKMENPPFTIDIDSGHKYYEFKHVLEVSGAKFTSIENDQNIRIVSPREFYRNNIYKFIRTIVDYGS
jgi:hypothetical protein